MKKSVSLILLASTMLLVSACRKVVGEGPIVTQSRAVPANFSSVAVSISGDIFYKHAATYNIELQAQQNILDVLESSVNHGELLLKFKNDVNVRSHERIIVTISGPDITGLTLSGSGNVKFVGNFKPNTFNLRISGSGNITVPNLESNAVDATISGSGNINILAGTINQETLKISGSGDMDLSKVLGKDASTTTSGSGSMKVNLTGTLHSTISGSGSVKYKGTPVVSTNISGSGKVTPL